MPSFETISVTSNKITQGNCKEGWISYKNDCYFFSIDKKDWFDAEEMCQEVDTTRTDVHLASCMTTVEAFYLSNVIAETNLAGNFYVGIEEMLVVFIYTHIKIPNILILNKNVRFLYV